MTVIAWLLFTVYYVAAVCIGIGYIWTIVLYVLGNRYLARWRNAPLGRESDYLWVLVVPALNEGLTIADSVARLRGAKATNKIIMVINDGSDDDTGAVLDSIAGPDLHVLTRTAPNARTGKGDALNNAYRVIRRDLLSRPEYARFGPDRTIMGIVDADGRLDPDAPGYVSRHFDDPRVGGVQVNVAIYNITSPLARAQEREFRAFGGLFQIGRSQLGTAFMGGNGQFNRLAALESVADESGPWRHFLTEDQELGLRLLEAGWRGEHEPGTAVRQQGLHRLRPLYRQRTRWYQGNLQVVPHLNRTVSPDLRGVRRLDTAITLILPILMIVVGAALLESLVAAVFFGVPYLPTHNPWALAFFLQLSIGPTFVGVMALGRGQGWRGIGTVARAAVPYIVYTWIMWPVVLFGLVRQFRGATSWAKTAREAVVTPPAPAG